MPLNVLENLIDKQDTAEIVRDQIAAILVAEIANQKALAPLAVPAQDPLDYSLRVYLERSDAWEQFLNDPPAGEARTPIVNISWQSASTDKRRSNAVSKQYTIGTYNIDVYGYGISRDDGGSGHIAADREAAFEAQRAIRLVRNILMAAINHQLQLVGTVGDRWVSQITIFQPQQEGRSLQNIVGARIALEVGFNEFSPQVQGESLEYVSTQIERTGDGLVILAADYNYAE